MKVTVRALLNDGTFWSAQDSSPWRNACLSECVYLGEKPTKTSLSHCYPVKWSRSSWTVLQFFKMCFFWRCLLAFTSLILWSWSDFLCMSDDEVRNGDRACPTTLPNKFIGCISLWCLIWSQKTQPGGWRWMLLLFWYWLAFHIQTLWQPILKTVRMGSLDSQETRY